MSSPEKKRKKKTTSTSKKKPSLIHPATLQLTPNPSIPDDLLLSCFVHVSRMYYPTLSLVSKSFRTLLASPELYQIRSSLGLTESCLYVCLESHPDPNPLWYTLCRKPDRILNNDIIENKKNKKKNPTGYVLAAISDGHTRPAHLSGLAAVGSNIYNIGGPIDQAISSNVSILDCKSNTWREAPNMRVERSYLRPNVFDGKIYVAGGSEDFNSFNWMEVFDPKTQTWESISCSGAKICGNSICKSAVIEGKIFLCGHNDIIYKPKEGTWQQVGWHMNLGSMSWVWYYPSCVIENVLYYYDRGVFKWYDIKERLWRHLKGVKGLPRFARYSAKMVDYGGKMAVFWDKIVTSSGDKNKVICCAVIALERRNSEEIWGKVQWHDVVLSVPMSYKVYSALASTV